MRPIITETAIGLFTVYVDATSRRVVHIIRDNIESNPHNNMELNQIVFKATITHPNKNKETGWTCTTELHENMAKVVGHRDCLLLKCTDKLYCAQTGEKIQ
jgi:hypothetical protein